ncbi:hypothetical protein [Nostoc commune]|uniref:hypothetical protein n=1 Tax=Nostoc commune TaxID=1178 RepID=UPI0018C60DE9|nr:hypothetical protein [Nostoc commune]MBG1258907.1 hypothetical protein [Nostoc commune BAE]
MRQQALVVQKGRKKDPEVFKDDIRLTPEKLRTVVGYLESINLGDSDRSIHPSIKQVFLNLTLHLESSRKSKRSLPLCPLRLCGSIIILIC